MDIKKIRLLAGMSQEQLASAAGVSRISIVRYESGERIPDLDVAVRIANALGVKVEDLIRN